MKTCSTCRVLKSEAEFSKKSAAPDGLQYECRFCASEHKKARYASDPERHKKLVREWARNNPERRRKIVRKWVAANPERRRKIIRKWEEANPERFIASRWVSALRRRIQKQGSEIPPRPTLDEAVKILDNLGDKCATCSGAGPFDIDHISPLRLAPELAYEPANLQRLCLPCHKAKTADERSI